MKKLVLLIVCAVLLAGCAATGSFEQLQDVYVPETLSEPARIQLTLPADAAAQTLTGGSGRLYFCDGYEIAVETLAGGDLNRTLKSVTGCEKEDLTLLQTGNGAITQWETVWTAAGEGTQRVGRVLILDDGTYHYCISVMADAMDAGSLQEQWESLFAGVVLSQ